VSAAPIAPTARTPKASGSGQGISCEGSRARRSRRGRSERERIDAAKTTSRNERDDDTQVDLCPAPARREPWPGSGSPGLRRRGGATSPSSGRRAPEGLVPWRRPPTRNASPRTRACWPDGTDERRLDHHDEACLQGEIEMNSSGRLRSADWRSGSSPARSAARLVGPLADEHGQRRQGDGADDEDQGSG